LDDIARLRIKLGLQALYANELESYYFLQFLAVLVEKRKQKFLCNNEEVVAKYAK